MTRYEINYYLQHRYDELMHIGKHGHYETMFQVFHEVEDMVIAPYKKVCDKFWSANEVLNDIPDDSDKAMAARFVQEALEAYREIRRANKQNSQ